MNATIGHISQMIHSAGFLPKFLATFAFGVAAVQTVADTVPDWIVRWGELLVLGGVALVWWLVRRTYTNHEERLEKLEKKEEKDTRELRETVTELRVTLAELRAACPICNPDRRLRE